MRDLSWINPGDYRWWCPPPFREGTAKIVCINDKCPGYWWEDWWEVTRISDEVQFSTRECFLSVYPMNEMEVLAHYCE